MDVYFKKEIIYPFDKEIFKFDVAETLFSTFDIDHGTDILIRAITPSKPKSILDLGCGYGPLGIILAKNDAQAEVVMVDKDLLAVRYAKCNIAKNKIINAIAISSLGVEEVKDKTFDLIVSNIPAKIGDEAITKEFILDPYKLLNPNGEYWIVVVSALNRLIPKVCNLNNIKVKEIKKRRGHTVYKIKKPNIDKFEKLIE
ncbi:MAG TPA: methyltransferase [Patescibacteria group bacterium]|nr:methyltransferase [Patescibacteria group bacterium]